VSKQPVNVMPHNKEVDVGLTPTLSFSGDSSTSATVVTQWQIREVSALSSYCAVRVTNMVISSPTSLGGSSWMSGDVAPYEFDGKCDYIDCNIPYQDYATLSVWVKPHSTAQQSIIAGNFAGLANNCWNTYGKGFQYFNGCVYAMGDFDGYRKKLSAQVGDQEWSHVVATFSTNGALYINGALKDSGDIGAGYKYSFAIAAGRKHRLDPAATLNELNFYGDIDDIRVYKAMLTTTQISNLWLSTRDRYANYDVISTNVSAAGRSRCYQDLIGADMTITTNSILFSDNRTPSVAYRSINLGVKRVWDSGEVTNGIRSISVPEGMLTNGRVYYWQMRYKDDKGMWSIPSEPTRFETVTDTQ